MRHEVITPDDWVEPLAAYTKWLHSSRKSLGTIKQHNYQLRRYAADTRLPPWPVTLEQLSDYLGSLAIGASALRTKRQALRGFYLWAMVVGRHPSNPAAHLPSIKVLPGLPRPATDHAVRVGRRDADERVRLMLELAVNVGLRCCEICKVHTRDVVPNLLGWSLVVIGKGGRSRLMPLEDGLARQLRAHPEGFLFEGQIDGHLSAARVSELISEVLPPGVTAHKLRHRYATRAFHLGGKDMRAVQELLGHAYVSTTQIYTEVTDEDKRYAALAAAS